MGSQKSPFPQVSGARKFLTSGIFMLVFGVYALYQNSGGGSLTYSAVPAAPTTRTASLPARTVASSNAAPADPPVASSAPVSWHVASDLPAPAKPRGQYADGSYVGTPADAYYGTVQVRVNISGGKIASVQFLQHPSDRRTSQEINAQAMPLLQQEAVQVQNAQVDGVSGATETSMAFRQSLSSALAQART